MSDSDFMHPIAKLDHAHVWHPFTQMRDWLEREPIVITEGKGAVLRDLRGREYIDANASIWTNLHGHCHPKINAAIRRQLTRISHSSALGFANQPASLLARDLVESANKPFVGASNATRLDRVFFSDDGSTSMEVALKLAYQFSKRTGRSNPKFLCLDSAYHGDTIGAVSLGHIDLFHKAYSGLLFKSDKTLSPYCYRCPFNRAKPERADARQWRQCKWECVSRVESAFARQKKRGNPYAAFVFEPLMQGAAGMIPQPAGWLAKVAAIAREHGARLIADEVMTGFGRTGCIPSPENPLHSISHFASHKEGVQPDFLCVAKGLTGGYLPMAATLTTGEVFDAFLGEYEEFKTFFHGHSFTGNQLGSAASLASLEILNSNASMQSRQRLERALSSELNSLWNLPNVGDIRQVGLVAGIELVRDWRTREPFLVSERAGIRVCEAMSKRGVLTRPVGNVIVIIPPYCVTDKQARHIVAALRDAIDEQLGERHPNIL